MDCAVSGSTVLSRAGLCWNGLSYVAQLPQVDLDLDGFVWALLGIYAMTGALLKRIWVG